MPRSVNGIEFGETYFLLIRCEEGEMRDILNNE